MRIKKNTISEKEREKKHVRSTGVSKFILNIVWKLVRTKLFTCTTRNVSRVLKYTQNLKGIIAKMLNIIQK